ncbi:MAG: MerR family transcriptional regulator [Hydrogenophaga sp.]|jgi:DNA-binding transcriptional MerR regulator|uniref:MerR family transcriptional regulator n=1 Tax=Hydrogenophaga sp. TaxID=1904254 RepID=UPI000ED9DDF6|nr:MerR family transcriptional regulator [Hydrogenophaga sp.]MDD3784088.1 MerR family transcriptional regulator [Hydrogenophaga sp.]MDX9967437.1 MerR family transcriptional regulator [Hydrogenophaga sp.]HAJ12777.1 MerR family transcriptional regulator [Comamonadaceae bacterium]
MLIGELAAASGVTRETLRFYEKQGLVRSRRMSNGYRRFPPETVSLVRYIRTAQGLGFSLAEIGDRLPLLWQMDEPAPEIDRVLQEKIRRIDERIAALQSLREALVARVASTCPLREAAEQHLAVRSRVRQPASGRDGRAVG